MTDKIDTIVKIIERAEPIARRHHIHLDRLTSIMDVENANDQYPLDLDAVAGRRRLRTSSTTSSASGPTSTARRASSTTASCRASTGPRR